jgi:hypothetical protein
MTTAALIATTHSGRATFNGSGKGDLKGGS